MATTRGTGGNGLGGGIESDASSVLETSGADPSETRPSAGRAVAAALAAGLYTLGNTTLTDTAITHNLAVGGNHGGQGEGGGVYIAGGSTILTGTTNVAHNLATTADNNIFGTTGSSSSGPGPAA